LVKTGNIFIFFTVKDFGAQRTPGAPAEHRALAYIPSHMVPKLNVNTGNSD
jgi:hypothetical protein